MEKGTKKMQDIPKVHFSQKVALLRKNYISRFWDPEMHFAAPRLKPYKKQCILRSFGDILLKIWKYSLLHFFAEFPLLVTFCVSGPQ